MKLKVEEFSKMEKKKKKLFTNKFIEDQIKDNNSMRHLVRSEYFDKIFFERNEIEQKKLINFVYSEFKKIY